MDMSQEMIADMFSSLCADDSQDSLDITLQLDVGMGPDGHSKHSMLGFGDPTQLKTALPSYLRPSLARIGVFVSLNERTLHSCESC